MTNDEAVTDLLDRLGLAAGTVGEARAAECRQVLADALADGPLPASWSEVWERVAALGDGRDRADLPYDLGLVFFPVNRALHAGVPFPRDFW